MWKEIKKKLKLAVFGVQAAALLIENHSMLDSSAFAQGYGGQAIPDSRNLM